MKILIGIMSYFAAQEQNNKSKRQAMTLININKTYNPVLPKLIMDPQGSAKYLDPRHLIMANLYATWDIDSKSYKMEVEEFKRIRSDFDAFTPLELFYEICKRRADLIFDDRYQDKERWDRIEREQEASDE